MPDEVTIEVVEPGSEDDPFRQPSDASSTQVSATASTGAGEEPDEDDDEATDEDDVEVDGEADDDEEDDDAELTEDEVIALQELEAYLQEQAAKRVEQEVVPRLQSAYDRQISAQDRKITELQERAAKREKELLDSVREAQLNGLPEAEKERLRTEWNWEDRQAQLDAREKELTEYHNEIQKAYIVQEYSQYGLQLEDLDEFETPEEMVEFAREVELEYYRLMVKSGRQVEEPEEDEEEPRAKKSSAKPKARVPAGAAAPSDGGGGPAVPESSKFNSGKGANAMAENIKNGWDTIKISS